MQRFFIKLLSIRKEDVQRDWWHIDAEGKILGRIAAKIARVLQGKHKPTYTPHVDNGDFIVITNCEKVNLTGNKTLDKVYYHHSLYPGGLKETSFQEMLEKKPEKVIEAAVRGMLPKTKLGNAMFKKLKIYSGSAHPHGAQNPAELDLDLI